MCRPGCEFRHRYERYRTDNNGRPVSSSLACERYKSRMSYSSSSLTNQGFVNTDDGARIFYSERKPVGGATSPILLLHSLFFDGDMFDGVVARLPETMWIIRPDHRGQGRSGRGSATPSIDRLASDTIAVIESVAGEPVHLVGSSMGGYVALAVAARRPELLRSCVLSCCTAQAEQDRDRFDALERALREQGPTVLVDTILRTMFGEYFLSHANTAIVERWRAHFAALDRSVADAVGGVFSRPSFVDTLSSLKMPVLLCSGDLDRAKRPADMAFIAERVAGSRHVVFDEAGHTPAVEVPARFADELIQFWRGLPASDRISLSGGPRGAVRAPGACLHRP